MKDRLNPCVTVMDAVAPLLITHSWTAAFAQPNLMWHFGVRSFLVCISIHVFEMLIITKEDTENREVISKKPTCVDFRGRSPGLNQTQYKI